MKRKISVALVFTMLLMTLTACGKFTCDLCEQEKSGKSHKSEILGEKIVICDECYGEMESLFGIE